MTDWLDTTLKKNVIVEKVSPNDIDEVIGILEGVDRGSSSIECGYYTDTRTSGSLTVVGDSYERFQFLRPIVEVPEIGHRRELGLYLVWNDPASKPASEWVYELELQSMLHTLSTSMSGRLWTLAANSKAMTAARQMLSKCGRQYVITGNDYVMKSLKAFDANTSWLSRLYGLAEVSGNRIDVDGHGRITIGQYVEPSAKTPKMTLNIDDPRGIIQSISMSSNELSMPNQVVVRCAYSETVNGNTVNKEVVGQADLKGGFSAATRGFTVTNYVEESDMSPRTVARANQLAAERLKRDTAGIVEWEIETPYLPLWEGDVVSLLVSDGPSGHTNARKCLVKSIDMELLHCGMKIGLKEVTDKDYGEE